MRTTKSFWSGFSKRAEALTGGGGHSGVGKMNLFGEYEFDGPFDGNIGAYGDSAPETRTDHTLLDRERGPKDFGVGEYGYDIPDDTNPHIIH